MILSLLAIFKMNLLIASFSCLFNVTPSPVLSSDFYFDSSTPSYPFGSDSSGSNSSVSDSSEHPSRFFGNGKIPFLNVLMNLFLPSKNLCALLTISSLHSDCSPNSFLFMSSIFFSLFKAPSVFSFSLLY